MLSHPNCSLTFLAKPITKDSALPHVPHVQLILHDKRFILIIRYICITHFLNNIAYCLHSRICCVDTYFSLFKYKFLFSKISNLLQCSHTFTCQLNLHRVTKKIEFASHDFLLFQLQCHHALLGCQVSLHVLLHLHMMNALPCTVSVKHVQLC